MNKLNLLLATTVGFLALGLAAPAAAEPSPDPTGGVAALTITPGAFCGKEDHLKFDQSADGDWYQCQKDGDVWRWKPVSSPTPTLSKSPTKKPTKQPTINPSPSKTTKAPVQAGGPELPRTGSNLSYIAGTGVVLTVTGGIIVFFLKTRKYKIEP